MNARSWLGVAIVGAFAVAGTRLAVHAEDEHARNVDPLRRVVLPLTALRVSPGVRVTEGVRHLSDVFPYVAVAPVTFSSTRATQLAPATLTAMLPAAHQSDSRTVMPIGSPDAAIEAVRLFVAGPLVTDAATAERLLATGRELAEKLEHLAVKVTDHRPPSWTPSATASDAADDDGTPSGWNVSLVAYEMDRMLRLVHVTATVGTDGSLSFKREPLVDGPMTSWQTAVIGKRTDAMEARQKAMHEEVVVARRAYARALQPAKTLDALWTAARLALGMSEVRDLFGEPDRDIGSGVHLWTYDLDDGTSVVFSAAAEKVAQVLHVRNAKGPLARFDTLGALYLMPGRR